jgi:uncharacterized protein YhbP (UPF0306 family)
MPATRNDPTVDELLSMAQLCLATRGEDGEPHCAALYFAAGPGLKLYFLSRTDSQHARDLAADPRAAASISVPSTSWEEIRGLQLRGEALLAPAGKEWEAGWQVYQAKFPFVTELKTEVERTALFVFTPRWVRLIDNRRGFGYKAEWEPT